MKPVTRYLGLAGLAFLAWGAAMPLAAQQTDQERKARVQPPAPLPL